MFSASQSFDLDNSFYRMRGFLSASAVINSFTTDSLSETKKEKPVNTLRNPAAAAGC